MNTEIKLVKRRASLDPFAMSGEKWLKRPQLNYVLSSKGNLTWAVCPGPSEADPSTLGRALTEALQVLKTVPGQGARPKATMESSGESPMSPPSLHPPAPTTTTLLQVPHHPLFAIKVREWLLGVTLPQARDHSLTLLYSKSAFGYMTLPPTIQKIILFPAGVSALGKGTLEFAVLLKLGYQAEDLLGSLDVLGAEVGGAVGGRLVQEVAVIDHEAARAGDAPEADVCHPVDAPHHGAILQVEVGHGVQGVAPVLLSVQVPGAEPHQGGLQRPDQPLGLHPLAAAQEGLESLVNGAPCDLRDFLTLGIGEQFAPPVLLGFRLQEPQEPFGESGDRRQT